jgi:hypothetical protein
MSKTKLYIFAGLILITGIVIAPFTSKSPDGLEATLELYNDSGEESVDLINSPVSGYEFLDFKGPYSSIAAGIIGAAITLIAGTLFARRMKRKKTRIHAATDQGIK